MQKLDEERLRIFYDHLDRHLDTSTRLDRPRVMVGGACWEIERGKMGTFKTSQKIFLP